MEPRPLALGAGSLNHWTTREVPKGLVWIVKKTHYKSHTVISNTWKNRGTGLVLFPLCPLLPVYPCDNNNEVFLSQEPDSISRGGLFIPLRTSLLNFVSLSFLPRLKLQLLRKEGKTVWVTGDTALLIKAQLNHGGRLAPLELSPVQSWGLSQLHKCFFSFILASAPSGPQLPGRWGLWGILHQVPWSGSSDSGHLQRCRVTFALLIMLLFPQVVLRFNWHVTLCKFKVYNKMIWYF